VVGHVHPGQGSEPTLWIKAGMLITWTGFVPDRISCGVCHADQNRMASIPTAFCTISSCRARLSGVTAGRVGLSGGLLLKTQKLRMGTSGIREPFVRFSVSDFSIACRVERASHALSIFGVASSESKRW
jgi:hypothetical protein